MAENKTDNTNNTRFDGAFDVFANQAASSADLLRYVKNIDANVAQLLQTGGNRNGFKYNDSANTFRNRYQQRTHGGSGSGESSRDEDPRYRPSSGFKQRTARTFEEGILEGLSEGILGFNWKKAMAKGLNNFAKNLGVELEDIPAALGKQLTKNTLDAFKKTGAGKAMMSKIDEIKKKLISELGPDVIKMFTSSGGGAASGFNIFSSMAGAAGTKAAGAAAAKGATAAGAKAIGTTALTSGGGAAGGGAVAAVAANPYLLLIAVAAIIAIKKTIEALGPAINGVISLFNALKSSGNRYQDERKKFLELEKKRLSADIESLITEPFTILKESAEKVEAAWDSALNVISATQGYNKEQTQALMSYVADRLRAEGLTDVVSGAAIIEKLPDVLKQGLSGAVAEEFAYQASILNAAIPTQDFFGYAATYSSIAANAIKQGKSQADAIAEANTQLKLFASNVLYSSRQLAGGFSTGLKDAQQIFEQSVRIAQASKFGNAAQISGVMTAVAGIVGAIAPDLATTLTDAVYQAAVGGNESTTVALRSLSGLNASNTEFLRQLATNPKAVFTQIFKNLGSLQNMAPSAYMEVADQVSQVFGLTRDTFARVDFNYLAEQISRMSVSDTALAENMELLASGQTTLTKDQLRNQQINKYMLEEGLSLVLDSEVGRAVQQHMWDEQLAREMMDAEYGVNLHGAALDFLEGIKTTVTNIINLLNPLSYLKKIVNIVQTIGEDVGLQVDLSKSLQATAVGSNYATELYQLTTRNRDLKLIDKYVNLVGGLSTYGWISDMTKTFNNWSNFSGRSDMFQSWLTSKLISTANKPTAAVDMTSSYTVGELAAASTTASTSRFLEMLQSMETFVKENPKLSYRDWTETAASYGIANWADAVAAAGYTETNLQGMFSQLETQQGIEQQRAQAEQESLFREKGISFFETNMNLLGAINKNIEDWKKSWTDYFIESTVYHKAFNNVDYAEIVSSEKDATSTAITKLAAALTAGVADLSDPTVQTNTILAQILLLLTQLVQQSAAPSGTVPTLESSLIGLALGGLPRS